MDKNSRMILALLFLLASTGSDIEARGPSAIAPATAAKAQDRTSVTGLVDNGRLCWGDILPGG